MIRFSPQIAGIVYYEPQDAEIILPELEVLAILVMHVVKDLISTLEKKNAELKIS